MELYKKYRPKKFEDLIGQSIAVKLLTKKMKSNNLPHTILFTGPSGCGKTTVVRILKRMLKCSKSDFTIMNASKERGIQDVRKIDLRMRQAPIDGDCRIWLIDEAHKLTNDAQNAFLLMLEDTPRHVYFMLATTHPQKLIKTIRTRSTQINLKSLSGKDLEKLLFSVSEQEQFELPEDVCDKIVENSDGSARKALVLLDQVIELDEEEMIDAIANALSEQQGFAVARALHNPKIRWSAMAKILKEVETEEPETIRWIVLGYARKVILSCSGLEGRAYSIIDVFRDHFYDSKHAGLVAACYEVVVGE